ncbi:nuclear transport factor 2 family protein [Nocardia caishijiensis]|uniref:SnoaL-like protein n=1 Tax=Nocardia caishijiensis TaxID=184756 RepID=A0ABQ6YNT0_9NOCA|nr:nuclear transport factor 2 family protein [Nocardia caishijiensis]KAF0847136.1 SnoaL-like protein [Nocardia caishijiensis]
MAESNTLADTLAITEAITRMFVYCDQKRWDDLVAEVFTDEVDFDGDEATAHADAIAVHVNNSAVNGRTRTFIGSYALAARRTDAGRRISKFHYLLKVIEGNADLT